MTTIHDSKSPESSFRILMLHGYASSASHLEIKFRRIAERMVELVGPCIADEFPDGIEFLYANSPMVLEYPILGSGFLQTDGDEAADEEDGYGAVVAGQHNDGAEAEQARGWWYGRDGVSRYKGIEESLRWIAGFIRGRPIHGIIGFSQGAALGAMVCSMLEACGNWPKIAAIRSQDLPVDDYLGLLPVLQQQHQAPRFFLGMGGYPGTPEYYGSLYRWPLRTPSCHTVASFDSVVEPAYTMMLAECFEYREVVEYYGTHFVPRDSGSVERIADFVLRHCGTSMGGFVTSYPSSSSSSDRKPIGSWETRGPQLSSSSSSGTVSSRSDRSVRRIPVLRRSKTVLVTSRRFRP